MQLIDCEECHRCGTVRRHKIHGWVLDLGHENYVKIKYCPYCGEKL